MLAILYNHFQQLYILFHLKKPQISNLKFQYLPAELTVCMFYLDVILTEKKNVVI